MDKLIKTMPAILKASGASEEVAEAACIAAWRHAVGEGLNSHAVPIQLQNQLLVVVVADNIWKKQLEQMRSQLLFRVNSVLGQALVKSVEFRVDPNTLAKARGPQEGASKGKRLDDKIPVELVSAAAGIKDVELRRAFLGAATSCVRRLEESGNSQIRNPNFEFRN
jgi:predicted nucleic acid-binding Zn ribbon protein